MYRIIQQMGNECEDAPVTYTPKHYLDLENIPLERLVYLSPNSREVLHKFDHEDVYILGG